ncbi:MAG TPA: glycine cleavage T C-terminal barrel domain-containing protein, partial [Acidimicrobiales bacterium]|nr:glycine cleavage T C-terminal barrel domain-containing protein [Acidimicrobiales bacterium]
TPLQAGLGWVVGWSKGCFRGREALELERAAGPRRHLVGLVAEGRQPPREHARVLAEGDSVGEVTSGNFSPVLERGIAMAFVDTVKGVSEGDHVVIEVRARTIEGEVVSLPFVRAGRPAAGSE